MDMPTAYILMRGLLARGIAEASSINKLIEEMEKEGFTVRS